MFFITFAEIFTTEKMDKGQKRQAALYMLIKLIDASSTSIPMP
jgi:hypothetical protein